MPIGGHMLIIALLSSSLLTKRYLDVVNSLAVPHHQQDKKGYVCYSKMPLLFLLVNSLQYLTISKTRNASSATARCLFFFLCVFSVCCRVLYSDVQSPVCNLVAFDSQR